MSQSNIHYSSGRALIKNTSTDDTWHYVDVEIFEGNPTTRINQAGITPSVETYKEYAILYFGGIYYKFTLTTNAGVVYYNLAIVADNVEPVDRLFLLGSDGTYYEITVVVFEGNPTIEIISLDSEDTTTICNPFKGPITLAAENTAVRRSISLASATCETDVVIPN